VTFQRGSTPESKIVQLFLEWSKQRLLSVSINFRHGGSASQLRKNINHPAFQALVREVDRWKELRISAEAPEDLCILRPPIIKTCPQLETLILLGFNRPREPLALNFSPMP